ncbi:MAG: alpha/beta hydrolase [Actinomycetota bacterium]
MSYPYDPEVQAFVPYAPAIDLTDIAATREMLSAATADLPPYEPHAEVRVMHLEADGSAGAPPVDLFSVTPSSAAVGNKLPALFWFHGGGFVLGDARESLPFLESVVRATGAAAFSIQYSLAPEARYPAPIDEGMAALTWIRNNSQSLGVDPERIAVGGQSAGGANAAGLVLRVRDEGLPGFIFQLLDIPVTDDAVQSESATAYSDGLVWNTRNALLSWQAYLGDDSGDTPAYAAPMRAESLQGMPPTFITVNQFDPLRDEGIEFAQRLAQASVPTELHMYAGTFHGSSGIAAAASVSQRQNADLVLAIKRAFEGNEK